MAWNETCVMDLKISLISDWLSGRFTKTMLASKYTITRPTVDKWINRYCELGINGLRDKSRRPKSSPNETPPHLVDKIVQTKREFPQWGPKKINDFLKLKEPAVRWPADSTTGQILKRAGLVKPRRIKRKVSPFPTHLTQSTKPSQVWNIDFKGQARLGNGQLCYPLTVTDDFSRYLLAIDASGTTSHDVVRACLERLFAEYGLPEVIKSDNGVPFASQAIGGLSRLSKWLIKLGIVPERIDKGKPTQNSRHERMHRTLKQETMKRMAYGFLKQQEVFDRFRYEFNELRSHEGLNRQRPSDVFKPSRVCFSPDNERVDYDLDMVVRSVKHNGEIKWKGQTIYLGEILAKEKVGLKNVDNERLAIYFSFMHIGYLNEKDMVIERIKKRT